MTNQVCTVPGPDNSCLATEPELPSAASYFLHTPLPTAGFPVAPSPNQQSPRGVPQGISSQALSRSPSDPVLTPAVPLLLNPDLMKGTNIQIISPQVHVSTIVQWMKEWWMHPCWGYTRMWLVVYPAFNSTFGHWRGNNIKTNW